MNEVDIQSLACCLLGFLLKIHLRLNGLLWNGRVEELCKATTALEDITTTIPTLMEEYALALEDVGGAVVFGDFTRFGTSDTSGNELVFGVTGFPLDSPFPHLLSHIPIFVTDN